MPPRARGSPALTLHWAAVGTGVKKCLGRLVTSPPPNYHLQQLPGLLGPLGRSLPPLPQSEVPRAWHRYSFHTWRNTDARNMPPAPRRPGCPAPAEGPGLRSLRGVPEPPWPPVAVHSGVASRTLPSPLRGVSARDRPRCNYLCLLPLWTTSVQAAEGLRSNSGRLGRTLNCLYRAGGTLRGRVPRAPLRVDF